MTITYLRLQSYLDAVAREANLDVDSSQHGAFWHQSYLSFVDGLVPSKLCNGAVVPIIDQQNPLDSAFFKILASSWCQMPQMPKTGPFVTNNGFTATLADGTSIAGSQILADIGDWLASGYPEHG